MNEMNNARRQGAYDLLQRQIENNLEVMSRLAVEAMDDLTYENQELRGMVKFLEGEQAASKALLEVERATSRDLAAKNKELAGDIQTLNHALGEAEKSKLEMFDLVKEINDALGLGDGTTREQILETIKSLRSMAPRVVPGSRWVGKDEDEAKSVAGGYAITVDSVDDLTGAISYTWDLSPDERGPRVRATADGKSFLEGWQPTWLPPELE